MLNSHCPLCSFYYIQFPFTFKSHLKITFFIKYTMICGSNIFLPHLLICGQVFLILWKLYYGFLNLRYPGELYILHLPYSSSLNLANTISVCKIMANNNDSINKYSYDMTLNLYNSVLLTECLICSFY